jgi:hypothetical protein
VLRSLPLTALMAAMLLALLPLQGARAQDETQQATQLLRDFIHYVRIARYDAAELTGQQLLALGVDASVFVNIVETNDEAERFRNAVITAQRAEGQSELELTAAALDELYSTGKLGRARDGQEIARNIALLGGNQRGRVLAEDRLIAAGEYAVPRLVDAFLRTGDKAVQVAASQVLIRLGQQAVMPLSVTLGKLAPEQQELVLGVLAEIPYRQSVPFVADLRSSTTSDRVRAAADRTLTALNASSAQQSGDAAWLYASLGEAYYDERLDVTSFPDEEFQLVWSYAPEAPELSLSPEAVRTEVYHEVMAMRLAAESLRLSPESPEALALWIASNLRREIQNPDGYSDPFYGDSGRNAEYFAVASGNEIAQRVLGRALDDRDTRLARRALDAVSRIAGGSTLWDGLEGRRPLVEAMLYPNRRVQYEAAMAIGGALPTSEFPGSERVIPLLAGAVRDADDQYALVLADDQEAYQGIRTILDAAGYQVLPRAASIEEARDAISETPGIDLIVVLTTGPQVEATMEQVRGTAKLAATPVLALVSRSDAIGLAARYERDPLASVRPRELRTEEMRAAIAALVESGAGGPVSEEEAAAYAQRALTVLRDLAITGGGALDPTGAAAPLIGSMVDGSAGDPMQIAGVLAVINDASAQIALMDQALAMQGAERVALLELVTHSVKRFGGRLEDRQIDRLVGLVANSAGDEGTAAAALAGALGLPNDRLIPLILGD